MNANLGIVVRGALWARRRVAAETAAPQGLRFAGALYAVALLGSVGCQDSTLPAAAQPVATRPSSSVSSAGTNSTVAAKSPSAETARPTPSAAQSLRPQALREITFDTVKLNMKKEDPFKRSLITPAIDKLDGGRVRIRGYILPPFQQTGLTRFVLVRDNMACCFGPGAAIYDSMVVDLKPGMTIDYTVAPVAVVGTFNIHEVEGVAGRPISIYHVTAEKVE
jgi:hypothetical protein